MVVPAAAAAPRIADAEELAPLQLFRQYAQSKGLSPEVRPFYVPSKWKGTFMSVHTPKVVEETSSGEHVECQGICCSSCYRTAASNGCMHPCSPLLWPEYRLHCVQLNMPNIC